MKFTLSWLKDHLDTEATLDTIAETLTRIGLEVEGVEDKAAALKPYVVARILTAEQHPNADRLRVCTVDTGGGRAGAGGLRRAERPGRPRLGLRAARHLRAGQEHHPVGRHDPRRREPRHAVLGRRARPRRRP